MGTSGHVRIALDFQCRGGAFPPGSLPRSNWLTPVRRKETALLSGRLTWTNAFNMGPPIVILLLRCLFSLIRDSAFAVM